MGTGQRFLVIVDPTATRQPAVERARELALSFGACIELFACYTPDSATALRVDERGLERIANGLREQGIDTTTDEGSAYAIHEGIVNKVRSSQPTLVIKDTHPHSALRRALIPNTDWHLINECPAPLLFVRPGDWRRPPKIAAAIDIAMPGHKPAQLDRVLLGAAEFFALATGGTLHAVHAHGPVSLLAATATVAAVPMAGPVTPESVVAENRDRAREDFHTLISAHPVLPQCRHFLEGEPVEVLAQFARTEGVDLMVMGAFSRGWVYNVFVGSTTERILDELPCDLLVMKPQRLNYLLSQAISGDRVA